MVSRRAVFIRNSTGIWSQGPKARSVARLPPIIFLIRKAEKRWLLRTQAFRRRAVDKSVHNAAFA
jgi:hypothetical protein